MLFAKKESHKLFLRQYWHYNSLKSSQTSSQNSFVRGFDFLSISSVHLRES